MTSLYPGTLFYTPGLNRRSTPTKAGTTSEELSKRYKRLPYNGRPWPAASPVAGVYDISNSSTQLIMMNNKVRKQSKLRGHNDPNQESERIPNPDRHSRSSTPVNKEFHTKCLNSQSPRYTPSICSELEWGTNSPAKFHDGSPVNPKRHTSCRVPTDPTAFQIGMLTESPRRSSSRLSLPARFQSSPLLTHPELKPGERAYLTHIARIYSAGQMMKLKQAQYNQLLFKEMEKGLYGRDEVMRYGKFINMGKDRQYQMPRPANGFRRAMSAPPQKYQVYDSNINNDDSFSTEKSSDPKSSDNEEKEGKRPKTGAPRSTKGRQLSPRSRTEQTYKSSAEIPPARSNKGPAKKPQIKARPIQNNRNEGQGVKGNNKKEESPATTSTESSSDNNGHEEGTSSHREGVGRPKSRLGHASTKTAADEQKRSESESSGKENPSDTSTTFQKVPLSSPRDEPLQTSENKPLTPVLENQTSSEQNDSSDSSQVRKDDSNTSSDESQHQQKSSSEESKVQQRSSDNSEGQQRSSDDSEGRQRSSDDSEGQQRSSDDSEGQQRSSDDTEGQQRSSADEDKSQLKSSQEESTGQDTSATEDYSREDEHNTKSDYTTSEEAQLTKSTTDNTYTSQTTQDKSGTYSSSATQDKSGTYSSSATQDVSPRDNSDSTNVDTYTMTYDSSATNQPTDNTTSDPQNLSTEKSSSAEDKTTTNYTDDSKVQQPRRDSLERDDVDGPRRVNKDIDTIEY
ncbi:dentin sialophosphoprotein-like [Mizuhopecten yessoensis]|uniref:dentin sialophosphoprotein-like n=1 Tax=Mizuhopecten yessoensis TaxID=6573 RepID=UPI000B45EFCB|nr:dentin sialophosphoprotein-like [Mizuhopecten yessoensis]XP_021346341.1 dentin sialophosphoprotein-like [Mizuhopecten yessoensis]XP_021346343.1 dentin sialophosphoprotein-like [Mizuhopecten yessoensis]XP_021346344.1 dentin sialophosphoprotein-like [Mizuhopecten yessoensis]